MWNFENLEDLFSHRLKHKIDFKQLYNCESIFIFNEHEWTIIHRNCYYDFPFFFFANLKFALEGKVMN